MAAGLQSFQSNDKQMQAIRELTNEVFNLKQKSHTDIANLQSDVTELQTNEIKIVRLRRTLDRKTVPAGDVLEVSVPMTPPDGYTLSALLFERILVRNEGALETVSKLVLTRNYVALNTSYATLFNTTSSDISFTDLDVTGIFTKISN